MQHKQTEKGELNLYEQLPRIPPSAPISELIDSLILQIAQCNIIKSGKHEPDSQFPTNNFSSKLNLPTKLNL